MDCALDNGSDSVLQTLSSETAREIVRTVGDEPKPPSEIADAVGTSIQNVQYHLGRLQNAGIVRHVDTWYSSRGCEMSVYALGAEKLVVTIDT
jgi:DNA-binding transcriptional ArsR family regulator